MGKRAAKKLFEDIRGRLGIDSTRIDPVDPGQGELKATTPLPGVLIPRSSSDSSSDRSSKVKFADYVSSPDVPNWLLAKENQAEALREGIESGQASGMGTLNRMGLMDSGAQAALQSYGGERLGRGMSDIESKINLAQVDYSQLEADRRNTYNQAKSAFEQGQYEFSAQLMAQYDAMTAEMRMRRREAESKKTGFWDVVGGLGGAVVGGLLGGPVGAVAGSQVGGKLTGGKSQSYLPVVRIPSGETYGPGF